jgi:hypothetical protein
MSIVYNIYLCYRKFCMEYQNRYENKYVTRMINLSRAVISMAILN